MPRIFQRYLLRELLVITIGVFAILVVIYISGRYVEFLGDAASGKIGKDMILTMMALKLATASVQLLPICFFFAVLMLISRMRDDNELVAMYASGIGKRFVVRSVTIGALALALVVAVLAFITSPWAEKTVSLLEARASDESDINSLSAGRFTELREGNRIIYASQVSNDRDELRDVFVQFRNPDSLTLIKSDSATMSMSPANGKRHIVLSSGKRYDRTSNRIDMAITKFERYQINLEQEESDPRDNLDAQTTASLLLRNDAGAKAELQWRLSFPLATVLFGFLGCAMGLIQRDKSMRSLDIVMALLIFFVYRNLLAIARTLIKSEDLSPTIGLWSVHIAVLVLAILIFNKEQMGQWPRRRRGGVVSASR